MSSPPAGLAPGLAATWHEGLVRGLARCGCDRLGRGLEPLWQNGRISCVKYNTQSIISQWMVRWGVGVFADGAVTCVQQVHKCVSLQYRIAHTRWTSGPHTLRALNWGKHNRHMDKFKKVNCLRCNQCICTTRHK